MSRFLLLIFMLSPGVLPGDDRYRAEFSDRLKLVTVEACFEQEAPRYLYRNSKAGGHTNSIRWGERQIKAGSDSGRFRLPHLPPNACISWEVDLAEAVAQSDRRLALMLGEDLVTPGNLWFWRDGDRRPVRIEIILPEGYAVSAPWKELPGDNNSLLFAPELTPVSWSSRIAIGRFQVQHIPVAGTTLRLASLGSLSDQQADMITNWISETAESVATVFGHFPRANPQVLVITAGQQREAVSWAHVVRGGGIGVEFFIDEQRPLSEFSDDWTATHELSHMLLPYIASSDRWLSEGLASYYQNVLRARDGRLSEQEAWNKLHSGFERGRAATNGGSLSSATRAGWSSVMRVYWSGAAMMLEADARLRSLSDGKQSLDTALAALKDCCFDPGKRWKAREVFTQLDQLTGFTVFSRLYKNHVQVDEFPDISTTYELLGLVPDSGSLYLDPDAPWARIRYFIMNDPGMNDPGAGVATQSPGM